jgi:hypothetical protein
MNRCPYTNEVWHSKRLRTYPQHLFESLGWLKVSHMAVVRNFEFMLEQTLYNSV